MPRWVYSSGYYERFSMPYTITVRGSEKPAYKLTCVQVRKRGEGGEGQPGCGFYGWFSFDRPLLDRCPRCCPQAPRSDRRLKIEVLDNEQPYNHQEWRKANWERLLKVGS